MKLEEIAEEAGKLSERDRASLVSQLIRGLGHRPYDVSDDEVACRLREGDGDESSLITFDQLIAGLRRRGN